MAESVLADILGIIGIGVGLLAIGATGLVEYMRKPRLRIVPVPWTHPGHGVYPMTFATAKVINGPLWPPLGFLNRDQAEKCRVLIDFWTWGDPASRKPVLTAIIGRWDSHNEPFRYTPVPLSGAVPAVAGTQAQMTFLVQYDPDRDTSEQDIAIASDLGQFSVAILRDGKAFAFANESYAYAASHFAKPGWELAMGETYRVVVHVKGANAEHRQVFMLHVVDDFEQFRLKPVEGVETS